eukprot:TRINITY_DN22785_c0_g1_i1.p1 TRINITY_DN22785_c0_g1~~TRINITY_DN22785_c0_g1_i1.p1  ORF type:complete len:158 (+),score=6.73 TRINITY_DN22785_c0_g1_i1:150-623(+)
MAGRDGLHGPRLPLHQRRTPHEYGIGTHGTTQVPMPHPLGGATLDSMRAGPARSERYPARPSWHLHELHSQTHNLDPHVSYRPWAIAPGRHRVGWTVSRSSEMAFNGECFCEPSAKPRVLLGMASRELRGHPPLYTIHPSNHAAAEARPYRDGPMFC